MTFKNIKNIISAKYRAILRNSQILRSVEHSFIVELVLWKSNRFAQIILHSGQARCFTGFVKIILSHTV